MHKNIFNPRSSRPLYGQYYLAGKKSLHSLARGSSLEIFPDTTTQPPMIRHAVTLPKKNTNTPPPPTAPVAIEFVHGGPVPRVLHEPLLDVYREPYRRWPTRHPRPPIWWSMGALIPSSPTLEDGRKRVIVNHRTWPGRGGGWSRSRLGC